MLFVLLAIEGATIVRIGPLLGVHVFVGTLLIGPAAYKIASTGWRVVRYYAGDPDYRQKGPPAPVLRLLGPLVVLLSVALLSSGVGLVLLSGPWRAPLRTIHQASFLLWFLVMSVHVLAHLGEMIRVGSLDWGRRVGRRAKGAGLRRWAIVSSLALGLLGAILVTPYATGWFTG